MSVVEMTSVFHNWLYKCKNTELVLISMQQFNTTKILALAEKIYSPLLPESGATWHILSQVPIKLLLESSNNHATPDAAIAACVNVE